MLTVTLKSGKDASPKRFHPWIFSGAIKKIKDAEGKEQKPKEGDLIRVESNKKEYPMSVDVVTRVQVAEKYEQLRETRNEKFPEKRPFPSWGTDQSMVSKWR